MTIAPGIVLPEAEISEICRRYQVKELAVFGSAARGELRPDSDIDLLVDFLPKTRPGLLDLAAMMRELSALLGRHVDLAVKPALKPLIRPTVLSGAQVIYAARSSMPLLSV
jgi:predicted nucleotidyltransferase